MHFFKYRAAVVFFVCLTVPILLSTRSMAQGNLLIYPKRLVFQGAKRSQELSLANNGKDTVHYIISVVQVKMKEDGSFEMISQPDSGQHFADKNFRFFPRSVTLGPNEAQTVKVQLIKTGELEDGEYRSHLYFRAEAEKNPLGEEGGQKDSSAISVRLVPVFGISIPVIIRVGESTTDIRLSNFIFQLENDSLPVLKMVLNRTGNMSVYGDITVDYVSPDGKEIRVGVIKGMALYSPTLSRQFRLPLEKNPSIDYHTGALHIVYTDISGPSKKIAQEQVLLH